MNTFDATSDSADASHGSTLRVLSRYLWPRNRLDLRIRVIAALSLLAAAKGINVYIPILYKEAVDGLTNNPHLLPALIIVGYGLARLLQQAFVELRDFVFVSVAQNAQRTVALDTFKHLHRLSLAFHLNRQTGGLSRVIERGTNGIQFLLRFSLFNIVPTLLEIALVTGILLYKFHYSIALTIFFTIVSYIFFTTSVTEWRLKYRKSMNKSDSEANTKAIDSLLNFETVKYFNNETHEFGRYDKALRHYESAAVKSQSSLSLLNVGQGFIISGGLVAVMLLAANGVKDNSMTVGDFVLINTYLIQLYLPLNFLGFVYREIKQSLVDMEKMFELLRVNPDIKDDTNADELKVTQGSISFSSVGFSYNPDRQIIHDLSFQADGGEMVAVVGSSGSGKSTIARLLFRFYDLQNGVIKIDGQDITSVTQQSLRKSIGVVPQDTVLFNDTIGYNIQYGNPEASPEEVINAAKLAQVHGFIQKLPNKYDTIVGERGLKLSGGEKQRVAIARTILKGPRILIFDEATSALDTQTEQEIQRSLDEVAKNRTTLVIAHRLSTIVNANQILVLQDGRLVEHGTHRELLSKNGAYTEMWQKQQEEQKYKEKLAECLDC